MGPRRGTFVYWGGPITKLPCVHQGNIHIKRKLQVWRDWKCISRVGTKPNSPVRAVKPPRLKLDGIGSTREASVNLGGSTTMVPSLHQRNIYIKRKLRVWTDWKCVSLVSAKTPLTCAGRQNTPSQGRRYRADKGNLRIMRWTYRYGTVFAPRQYLYQKVPTGMERPEMYFPSRCKNPTHLCGPSKYPV